MIDCQDASAINIACYATGRTYKFWNWNLAKGSVSETEMLVSVIAAFGFVRVSVNFVVSPTQTSFGSKVFVTVGAS